MMRIKINTYSAMNIPLENDKIKSRQADKQLEEHWFKTWEG